MDSKVIIALIAVTVAAGCVGQTSQSSNGEFNLLISDQRAAIDDFEKLDVTFSTARVFRSGEANQTNKTNDDETYQELSLESQTVDLTKVKGAKAESILNTSLEAGNYSKIELYVEDTQGIVNGSEVDVKVPPEKLMITKNFEVKPNHTTRFVFDIQVVLRGNQQNNQGYILKPVISESGVAGKDVEVEEPDPDRENESGGRPENAENPPV